MCMEMLLSCTRDQDLIKHPDGTCQISYSKDVQILVKPTANVKKLDYAYMGSINEDRKFNGFGILVQGQVKSYGQWENGLLNG